MTRYKSLVKDYYDLFEKDDQEQKEAMFGYNHMKGMKNFVDFILAPQDE